MLFSLWLIYHIHVGHGYIKYSQSDSSLNSICKWQLLDSSVIDSMPFPKYSWEDILQTIHLFDFFPECFTEFSDVNNLFYNLKDYLNLQNSPERQDL